MNSSYYKHCIVPQCKSTTIKTPNKLFIYVPNNEQIRKKWLKLARRDDVHSLSTNSRMYFCADHFDLPNDMVNYIEYHVMGTVSQVRMKPGCTPSKFECQEHGRKRTCSSTEQSYTLKKQRIMTIAKKKPEESCTPSSSLKDSSDISSDRGRRATGAGGGAEHPGLQCGHCSGRITGFRYTCVQCEDFDLCATCEARAEHDHHYVLRVPGPRPHGEVRAVVERVRRELLSGVQPLVASGDDGDSVKVEVKQETDPGPDPLQDDEFPLPYYPEMAVEVVTERLQQQSTQDVALQTIKLEPETDDEALDLAAAKPKPQQHTSLTHAAPAGTVVRPSWSHTSAEERKSAAVRLQQNIMVEVSPAKRRLIEIDVGVVTQGPAAAQIATTSRDPVGAQRDSGSFGFEGFAYDKGGGDTGWSPDTVGGASRDVSAAMRQTKKARSRAAGAEQQRGAKRK